MNRHELTKRAAIVGDDFVVIGRNAARNETLLMCKRCATQFLVLDGTDQELDPSYGHDCAPRPLHPALAAE